MTTNNILAIDKDYLIFFENIKKRLKIAQIRAAKAVSIEVIKFNWQLGKDILQIQSMKPHWGSKFLDQLSHDLQNENPGASGFSKRNLEYMRLFASVYPEEAQIAQQPAAQLPWAHIQVLLDKFKNEPNKLEWYGKEALINGWSRSTLNMHIKSSLYKRQSIQAEKTSNYKQLLVAPQSDLAYEMLKNPYNFDFLTISKDANEREIEKALTTHIRDFLIELGSGFAFVGSQVPIEIDGESFFIDLLFFHLKLRSFVAVELKAQKFKPADLGQLSFYLAAIDEKMRHPQDNPTIGILLCESRSKIIAEYALKKINAPIGVSEYILSKDLPKELKSSLPTIEELEAEFNEVLEQKQHKKDTK
jgi:predicted nuclease of restriction endonuclease-like (RecB) superfamily